MKINTIMKIFSSLLVSLSLSSISVFINAAPPDKFAAEVLMTEIDQPISIRFLPDGRLFMLQKKGPLRIVDVLSDVVTSEVYMDLSSISHSDGLEFTQERGVLDIALDPDFPQNPYIYVLYTPATGPNGPRMRVARFIHQENNGGLTSRGDVTSEVILWQDTDPYDRCCHFGGALDFGPEGYLWISTGDHFQGSYAENLEKAGGKIHRIAKDGSIPASNPYQDGDGPNVDSIIAYGLRNPFRARWDLAMGRYFIAEVGGNDQQVAWEDLHVIDYDYTTGRLVDSDHGTEEDNSQYDGINFGWPTVEGMPPYLDFPDPVISNPAGAPIFAWRHNGIYSAINGGVVYRGSQFPAEYQGAYFYADSTRDFVRYVKFDSTGNLVPNPDPAPISLQSPDQVSYAFDLDPTGRIVSLDVGPDGSLYYVSFMDSGGAYGQSNPSVLGSLRRYVYDGGNPRPAIANFAADFSEGPSPLAVQFSLSATDANDDFVTYYLDFGDGNVSAEQTLAVSGTVIIPHTYGSDGVYTASVYVSDSNLTTTATTKIEVGSKPVFTSLTSTNLRQGGTDTRFRYGDSFVFSASAMDVEDGGIPGSGLSWDIVFVRPGNVHPVQGPNVGDSIEFTIPSQGQGFSGHVFYRIHVQATDSNGLSSKSTIEIFPEKADIQLHTVPSGLNVQVNGNAARATPFDLDTLINWDHTITFVESGCIHGVQYMFDYWLDEFGNTGTSAQLELIMPEYNIQIVGYYVPVGDCTAPPDGAVLHLNAEAGVVEDGGMVMRWIDQSNGGNTLLSTGDPIVVPNIIGGRPAIRFDGVDDALYSTGFSGLPVGSAARTVFMVGRYTQTGSGSGWAGFAYGTPASNQAFGLTLTPSGTLGIQGWGSRNDFESNPAVNGVGSWGVFGATVVDGEVIQYLNGDMIGRNIHQFATGTSGIRIGEELNGGNNVGLDVAEIIAYDRALNAENVLLLNSYLMDRYSIRSDNNNMAPSISILTPLNNVEILSSSMPVVLSVNAEDTEDGNLSAQVLWTSNIDGALGEGNNLSTVLSIGQHLITASVTDSQNATEVDQVSVTVVGLPSGVPSMEIIAPPSFSSVDFGVSIEFVGTATDMEDGELSNTIIWSSDLDGALGSGGTLLVDTLSLGSHTVTASVQDSDLNTASATISLNVRDPNVEGVLVTSGLVLQLESDLNVATQGGNTVGGWLDQSGLGLDMVAYGNPLLIAGGTPSGQPAIVLDGVDDKLERLNAIDTIGGLPSGNLNRTMFVVAKYDSAEAWGGVTYGSGLANQAFGLGVNLPGGHHTLQGYGRGNDLVSSSVALGEGWHVQSAVLNNSVSTLAVDGEPVAEFTHSYDTVLNKLIIGEEIAGRGRVGMAVAAVLIYDRVLSTAEQSSTLAYLQNKYLVSAPANEAPSVLISEPSGSSEFHIGEAITFSAVAVDDLDGDISVDVAWVSDLDGLLGTGNLITISTLSSGFHSIQAVVTDSTGLAGMATVTILVKDGVIGLVTQGLVVHLESDFGVVQAGEQVLQWDDASGFGNDLFAVGSVRPVSTATPSGMPAIYFDGYDDYLERLHLTEGLVSLPTGAADRTMFLVARYNAVNAWAGASYGSAARNKAFGLVAKSPSGELVLQGHSSGNDLVSTTSAIGLGWIVQSGKVESNSASLYLNGTQVAQFSHAYDTQLDRLVVGEEIGDKGGANMYVAALLIYDRALTEIERFAVEDYLYRKYF